MSEIAEMFAERHGLAPAQRKRLKKLLLDNLAAAQGQEEEEEGSRREQYLEQSLRRLTEATRLV